MWKADLEAAEPVRVSLTTATTTPIVPANNNRKQPIAKIHVANISSAAATIDLEIYDGATSFYLEKGRSIAANASYELRDDILQVGQSLRAKAGTAGAFDVHVLLSQPYLT